MRDVAFVTSRFYCEKHNKVPGYPIAIFDCVSGSGFYCEKHNKVPGYPVAIFDCVSGSGSYLIITQEVFSNIKIEKQQYKYRPLKKFMI